MEDVESRFAHLLQPIRELTKNWEIDVAAQLGEYLEELDQICISFDDGKTTMNFAEAALLIQGSACIYSRKVEYLYSLVYQALDLISNKKRNQKASSIGENGTDNDLSLDNQKREWEFLSLDDIECPTTNKIDMRKDASFPVVNVVPLTPLALIPPEELEKKNNPLFSRRGEILGSRKDFRMNTCTPHATGAFMLELNNASPMNFLNKQQQDKAVHDRNDLQGVTQDVVMENSDCQTPVPKLNFLNDVDYVLMGHIPFFKNSPWDHIWLGSQSLTTPEREDENSNDSSADVIPALTFFFLFLHSSDKDTSGKTRIYCSSAIARALRRQLE